MLYRPVKMYNLGLTKLGYSNVQKRYSERCAFIITWTICRGCTESVGKFPRPWTGTVSPRIESKRCTCSQDNTQNRRHCSDTSPEDMSMERTTSFKKAKTSALLPHRYRCLSKQMRLQRKIVCEKLSYFTVARVISYLFIETVCEVIQLR